MACLHPGGLSLTEILFSWGNLTPGARILDLGCGQGDTLAYMREHGFDGVGVDLIDPPAQGAVCGDMKALPFPSRSFDAVLLECSLSACGDEAAALKEAHRVLRPGGALLLSDVFFPGEDGNQAQRQIEALRQMGFLMLRQEDFSSLTQAFFLRLIWETGKLPEEWNCIAAGRRPGYFAAYGKKA